MERGRILTRVGLVTPAAVAAHPAVLAILPVDRPSGDAQAEYLGAGIGSVVTENLGSIPGLTVLPDEKTRDVLERDLGADAVLSLALTSWAPNPTLVARLRRPAATQPVWEQTVSGDPLVMVRTLLDALVGALDGAGMLRRRVGVLERERVRKLPTTSGDALMAYSHGQALVDRSDVPGNLDAAIRLFEQALASDSRFAAAEAALGSALWAKYQKEKDPAIADRATRAVLEALRLDPNHWQVYYALGDMRLRTGQTEQAVRAIQQALALQPDSDDAHRLLGRIYITQQRYEDAKEELRQAIRIRPADWLNSYYLGYASFQQGKYEEALDVFRRTTELQPTAPNVYMMLGTTYQMLGDTQQAIGNYEHSVRLGPNANAYANLAFAYFQAERYQDAIGAYEAALEREPSRASLHRDLADILQHVGRTRDARARYQEAIELARHDLSVNPADADGVGLIALCEARLGRRLDAERHAAEAVALMPGSGNVLFRTAQVYALLGQREAALNALRSAIAHGARTRAPGEAEELISLKGTPEYDAVVRDLRESQ
jgi:tetratricopeptide (TPR) repeat protein